MNPKQFLTWGGVILVLLGIYGFFDADVPGSAFYLDSAENYAHLILGIVAIVAARSLSDSAQRSLTLVVGIVAIIFAVWGYVVAGRPEPNLGVTNLEHPADNLLHLVVGIWALVASRGRTMMAPGM
jgi:hypothetical protein